MTNTTDPNPASSDTNPAPPTNPTNNLIYDDTCPLCTFQTRFITWVDWFNTVRLVPLSHDLAKELAGDIPPENLSAAIHCITANGTVHRGARALRHVGMRLPLFFLFALILWIPGIIQLAEIFYMWISRNRHLLSKLFGCKEACSIMPTRQREQDVTNETTTQSKT